MAIIYTHTSPRQQIGYASWTTAALQPTTPLGQIINVALIEQQDFADIRQSLQMRFPIDTDLIFDAVSLTRELNIGERLDIVDGLRKIFRLGVPDNQASADIATKIFSKFLGPEQQAIADSVNLARALAFSERQDVADGLRKLLQLDIPDNEATTDATAKIFHKFLGPEEQHVADAITVDVIVASVVATIKQAVFGRALNLYSPSRRRPLFATHPIIGYVDVPAGGTIVNVNLADQQDFADILRLLHNIFPIDTDAVQDGLSIAMSKFTTDRQDLSDVAAKTFLKFLVGEETISDETEIAFIGAVSAAFFGLLDYIGYPGGLNTEVPLYISLIDTEHVSDGAMKSLRLDRSDSQSAVDIAAKIFGRFLGLDREDVSDSASFNRVSSVSTSDNVAISDIAQKIFNLRRSEQQDIADNAVKTFLKFLADNEAISDVAQALSFFSVLITESQDVIDGLRKSFQINRPDIQATSDATTKTFNKFLSDNEAISDVASFIKLVSLFFSDRGDVTDGIRKLFGLHPSDSAEISDATIKLFIKALTDREDVSDASSFYKIAMLGLSDSIVINDILAKTLFKNLAEQEDNAETIRKIVYMNLFDIRQDLSEAISLAFTLGTPGPAAAFVEYAVTSIVDAMHRAVGNIDPIRRRETIADSLRRVVGEKIGKRK